MLDYAPMRPHFLHHLAIKESDHAKSGKSPEPTDGLSELFISQTHEWNARKSEALSLAHDIPALLKARSLLMRGKLQEAQVMITALCEDEQAKQDAEILLEKSRLASYRGEWSACAEYASLGIAQNPTAVTLLTLLQVRALAGFESEHYLESLKDIQTAESLTEFFPKCTAGFYARALECKVRAKLYGVASGRALLSQLWETLQVFDWNANFLLTLCRIEIYLATLENKNAYAYALACYVLAKHLGDQLYTGFALADLIDNLPLESRSPYIALLAPYLSDSPKLKRWYEAFPNKALSTLAPDGVSVLDLETTQHLYFSEEKVMVNLKPWRIKSIETGKVKDAIHLLLVSRTLKKSDFFSKLWGTQKYSPRLHDNLIWNLSSRVRKQLCLELEVKQDQIVLTSGIVKVGKC